jgi:hypothetical protein
MRAASMGRLEEGRPVITAIQGICPNPACSCDVPGGCSPWCRALDRPAGERCRCGHESCAPAPARRAAPAGPARLASRASARAPGVTSPRWLVIVRRDRPELEPAARRRVDELLGLVVVDRRRRDRRRGGTPVDADRRRGERRRALTPEEADRWQRAGYRLVCRASTSAGAAPGGGQP